MPAMPPVAAVGSAQAVSVQPSAVGRRSVEPRFFLCTGQCVKAHHLHLYPNSHIVGHLAYVTHFGHQVTALMRWVVSVKCTDPLPTAPELDEEKFGGSRNVRCLHPGCKRRYSWESGQAELMALLSHYGKERLE